MELRAVWENLAQLGEGALSKCLLATVVTSEWVGPFHNPVHVVSHVFEEGSSVSVFKSLEDFANTVACNSHLNLSLSFVICHLRFFKLLSLRMTSLGAPLRSRAVSSSPSPGCFPPNERHP